MRKVVFLLAIITLAGAPSLASAKARHAHHAAKAKVEKPQAGPNDNTFRLFGNMFTGK